MRERRLQTLAWRCEAYAASLATRLALRAIGYRRTLKLVERTPALFTSGPEAPLPESWFRVGGECLGRSVAELLFHRLHGRTDSVVIGVSVADDDFSAHAWLQSHEVPAGWSELRDLEPDPARPRLRGVVGVAELSEETTVVLTPDERYLVLTGLSSVVFDQLVRGEAHERIRDFLIDRYRIDSARAAADLVAVESDLQRAGVLITS